MEEVDGPARRCSAERRLDLAAESFDEPGLASTHLVGIYALEAELEVRRDPRRMTAEVARDPDRRSCQQRAETAGHTSQ